jgi:TonB family protein
MGRGREWVLAIGGIVLVASLATLISSALLSARQKYVSSAEHPGARIPELPAHAATENRIQIAVPPGGEDAIPVQPAVPIEPDSWLTSDDLKTVPNRWEAAFRLQWTVQKGGRVTDCKAVEGSGHPELDEAFCNLIVLRARYKPARNAKGAPVDSLDGRRIVWRLPD